LGTSKNSFLAKWPENAKICSFRQFFCCNAKSLALINALNKEYLWFYFLHGGFSMAKKTKEMLVVASKVRGYIRSKKMMTSSDSLAALNDKIHGLLDDAMDRTKANRRSTVKAQDL
jgi:hypothetical protein